jgi:hypothetical protein
LFLLPALRAILITANQCQTVREELKAVNMGIQVLTIFVADSRIPVATTGMAIPEATIHYTHHIRMQDKTIFANGTLAISLNLALFAPQLMSLSKIVGNENEPKHQGRAHHGKGLQRSRTE